MKARERKQLLSLLETGLVCRENIALVSLLPGMLRSVKKYDQLLLDILESMFGQKEVITHHAKEKLEVRKKLAEHTDYLSSLAYAFASGKGCYQLMAQFKHTYSSVFRSRDTDVVPVCMHIYKGLTENQDKLKECGIRKKDTEDLLTLIKKFEKLMTLPGTYINRRMVQTQNLQERLAAAGKTLKEETDNLVRFFKTYPEFKGAYKASRKQVKGKVTEGELEKMIKEFYLAPKPQREKKKKQVAETKMNLSDSSETGGTIGTKEATEEMKVSNELERKEEGWSTIPVCTDNKGIGKPENLSGSFAT